VEAFKLPRTFGIMDQQLYLFSGKLNLIEVGVEKSNHFKKCWIKWI